MNFFLKFSNYNDCINSFVFLHVILYHLYTPCESASAQTFMDIVFDCWNASNHLCIAIASKWIPKHHSHHGISETNMFLLTLCLFVKLHDDYLECKQWSVNVLGFVDCLLVVVACLVDPLWTCQIDKVKLWQRLDIRSNLLRLYLDYEYAVRSCRCIVLRGFRDNTICVSDKE